jgi:cytochrome c biogenesis protein CcmG/thiol:disulfide interchange protein DsbE
MVDKEVPVFTLDIYDLGKQHDRSILKGRPMLLNVWATWCRPATGSTPTSSSWRGRIPSSA